jgi:hypothetical protein
VGTSFALKERESTHRRQVEGRWPSPAESIGAALQFFGVAGAIAVFGKPAELP